MKFDKASKANKTTAPEELVLQSDEAARLYIHIFASWSVLSPLMVRLMLLCLMLKKRMIILRSPRTTGAASSLVSLSVYFKFTWTVELSVYTHLEIKKLRWFKGRWPGRNQSSDCHALTVQGSKAYRCSNKFPSDAQVKFLHWRYGWKLCFEFDSLNYRPICIIISLFIFLLQ